MQSYLIAFLNFCADSLSRTDEDKQLLSKFSPARLNGVRVRVRLKVKLGTGSLERVVRVRHTRDISKSRFLGT